MDLGLFRPDFPTWGGWRIEGGYLYARKERRYRRLAPRISSELRSRGPTHPPRPPSGAAFLGRRCVRGGPLAVSVYTGSLVSSYNIFFSLLKYGVFRAGDSPKCMETNRETRRSPQRSCYGFSGGCARGDGQIDGPIRVGTL